MDSVYEPPSGLLWKYRKWDSSGHARAMIESGEVYFARKSELNDPMDLHWREDRPKSVAERRKYAQELSKLYFPEITRLQRKMQVENWVQDLIDESASLIDGLVDTSVEVVQGLLSCSEVNDDFLMWSHYSGGHQGICVGLQPEKIEGRFWKCIYQDDPPILDFHTYITGNLAAFRTMSRTKSARWSYEREWRSISTPGASLCPGCVDSIVFGLNTDAKTRKDVQDSIERSGQAIKLLQIKRHRQLYKLEATPLSGA